jgi:hypothetical protein
VAPALGQTKSHTAALHFSCAAFSHATAPPASVDRSHRPPPDRLPTPPGRPPPGCPHTGCRHHHSTPPPGRHQAGRVRLPSARTSRAVTPATDPAPAHHYHPATPFSMSLADLVVSTLLLVTVIVWAPERCVVLVTQATIIAPTATPSCSGVGEDSTTPTLLASS